MAVAVVVAGDEAELATCCGPGLAVSLAAVIASACVAASASAMAASREAPVWCCVVSGRNDSYHHVHCQVHACICRYGGGTKIASPSYVTPTAQSPHPSTRHAAPAIIMTGWCETPSGYSPHHPILLIDMAGW